jgi:hypothetical protein
MFRQHWRGMFEKVHVGIVKGQRHGPGRQLSLTAQAGNGRIKADHRVTEAPEHAHLCLEPGQVAILTTMGGHAVGKIADTVVHQNMDTCDQIQPLSDPGLSKQPHDQPDKTRPHADIADLLEGALELDALPAGLEMLDHRGLVAAVKDLHVA